MQKPTIVSIPKKMQKYYGSGQMLHPEMEMIEEFVELIPKGKVITIDVLAKKLAKTYGADVTCPMRTGNHLKRLSKTDSKKPFWRVIRKDHMMVKLDNYEHWATILEKEGFVLEFTKSNQIRVLVAENQFFGFRETS